VERAEQVHTKWKEWKRKRGEPSAGQKKRLSAAQQTSQELALETVEQQKAHIAELEAARDTAAPTDTTTVVAALHVLVGSKVGLDDVLPGAFDPVALIDLARDLNDIAAELKRRQKKSAKHPDPIGEQANSEPTVAKVTAPPQAKPLVWKVTKASAKRPASAQAPAAVGKYEIVWVTTSDRREGFEVTQTRGKGYRHLSDNYWATLDEAMAEAQADHDAGRDVEPKFIERVSVPLRF
jgi:hypothetical protein